MRETVHRLNDTLAKFVFSVLYKSIYIINIPELGWHLFCKHLAENSILPPTTGSLEEHIERVHVQAVAWTQATLKKQHLLDLLENGYYWDGCDGILPITTKIPPVTHSII